MADTRPEEEADFQELLAWVLRDDNARSKPQPVTAWSRVNPRTNRPELGVVFTAPMTFGSAVIGFRSQSVPASLRYDISVGLGLGELDALVKEGGWERASEEQKAAAFEDFNQTVDHSALVTGSLSRGLERS